MKSALFVAALLAVLVVPSSVVETASADPCVNAPGIDDPLGCEMDCEVNHEYGYCDVRIGNFYAGYCFYTPDNCQDRPSN